MKRPSFALIATLFMMAECVGDPDASYSITVDRPSKVGDKCEAHIHLNCHITQAYTINGKPNRNDDKLISGSLDSTIEVLAINDKFRSTKFKLTVNSLKFSDSKKPGPEELISGGKVVLAELKDGEKVFTAEGVNLDDRTREALRAFVKFPNEKNCADPVAFLNIKTPHAIGDVWDANMEPILKSWASITIIPLDFDKPSSTARIKFEKIEKIQDISNFVLSGCVALKATGSTMKGLPEGSKMTEAFLKMSFVSSFPVDPSLPIWSGNVDWDLEIAADVPTRNGKTAKFKLISKQTTEVAQKPVK